VFTARPNWDIFLNFGRGFHSNDARGVTAEVDPADPTAQATGAEIGSRVHFLDTFPWLRRTDLAVDFFFLDLDSELVFVGDAGTTEPSGATRRYGVEFEGRWQILDWLWADFDATWSDAFFRDEPSDANEVPLAPRYTLKGGFAAKHRSGLFGSIRERTISDRPANEDDSLTAQGFTVFDLQLGYTRALALPIAWLEDSELTVKVELLNMFDKSYREAQFDTASCTKRERALGLPGCGGASPPGISNIDFTPGWPRTVIAGIKLEF
jgi:outer membrane receptor protein involved in Fe transport